MQLSATTMTMTCHATAARDYVNLACPRQLHILNSRFLFVQVAVKLNNADRFLAIKPKFLAELGFLNQKISAMWTGANYLTL